MIKHIVMWKFQDEADGRTKVENMQIFKDGLEALVPIIPEIKSLEVGINEVESDASYDIILVSTFNTIDDLKFYATHPEHLKVGEFCAKVRISRVVVDYTI